MAQVNPVPSQQVSHEVDFMVRTEVLCIRLDLCVGKEEGHRDESADEL